MSNRTIYNIQGLYAGPAPASGFHWINDSGNLVATHTVYDATHHNLVKPISRVQSCSFNENNPMVDVSVVGNQASVVSAQVQSPEINVNFTYIQHGIINELRMGLYANYFQNTFTVYGDFERPALSGLVNRSFARTPAVGVGTTAKTIDWPLDYRDCRNFFLTYNSGTTDLLEDSQDETSDGANELNVIGFGNGYMTSYEATASIGAFPQASVGYTFENIEYFYGGSGQVAPSLIPVGVAVTNRFDIPSINEGTLLTSALRPGDITIKISNFAEASSLSAFHGTGTLGYNYADALSSSFTSLNIQNYKLNLNLNRVPLNNLGYRIPADRVIEFPVFADISLSILDNQDPSGLLFDTARENKDHYLSMRINDPGTSNIALQYDFLRAKYLGSDSSMGIGDNRITNYNFRAEIDLDDATKGMYISGMKNVTARPIDY